MISLCTTNYNKALYLDQFFSSIDKYEKKYITEIIIVDDNSSDNSSEIIKQWIKKTDISIKLIQHSSNKWPAAWYQRAISEASNEYIMILDSDDFLIRSSLEEKIKYFTHHKNCKIVYGDGWKYVEQNNTYIKSNLNKTFFTTIFNRPLKDIKEYFHTNISNLYVPWCLVKKQFLESIGGFDTTLKSNDWVLNIRIFDHINNKEEIWYIDIPCFAYRISTSNLSNRYDSMSDLMIWVAEKYTNGQQKIKLMSNIYFTIWLQCIRNWDKKMAIHYFKKSYQKQKELKKCIVMVATLLLPHSIISSSFIQKNAQLIYNFFNN